MFCYLYTIIRKDLNLVQSKQNFTNTKGINVIEINMVCKKLI